MSRSGLVLAHGRGGSAGDMQSLFRAARLGDVALETPEAPDHSWWPSSFLAPSAVMEPFVQRGLAAMAAGIARLEAQGIARNRIWLGGFSQGAGLALESFARQGEGLAGVFGFSGGLIGTSDSGGAADPALYGHVGKNFSYPGRRDGARVWLSVHERDPHIPALRVEETRQQLLALGAEVQLRVMPGQGHGMSEADLRQMHDWLAPEARD